MPRKIGHYSMARDTVTNLVNVTNQSNGEYEGGFTTWDLAQGWARMLNGMEARRNRIRARIAARARAEGVLA